MTKAFTYIFLAVAVICTVVSFFYCDNKQLNYQIQWSMFSLIGWIFCAAAHVIYEIEKSLKK